MKTILLLAIMSFIFGCDKSSTTNSDSDKSGAGATTAGATTAGATTAGATTAGATTAGGQAGADPTPEVTSPPDISESPCNINTYKDYVFKTEPGVACNLIRADLPNEDFTGANLTNAHCQRSNLADANFERSVLFGAQMQDSILYEANFSYSDCREVNFTDAKLYRAHFHDADCRGANFTNADVRDVVFSPTTKLENTDFTNATIYKRQETNFREVTGFTGALNVIENPPL